MKIIKMGNISNYRNICPYCSCEYEYDDSDVNMGYNLTMPYAYVYCPCCNKENSLHNYNYKYNSPYPYYNPISMYNASEDNLQGSYCSTSTTMKSYMEDKNESDNKN